MEKFTPGKWVIGGKENTRISTEDESVEGDIICYAPIIKHNGAFTKSQKNWEANARLIAAAPEMYAILNEILKSDGMMPDTLGKINQLLNKVTPIK